MKNSIGIEKVIGGILIGTLFGVALRMLFASPSRCKTQNVPITGDIDIQDLRKKMKNEAKDLRRKAEELENHAKE